MKQGAGRNRAVHAKHGYSLVLRIDELPAMGTRTRRRHWRTDQRERNRFYLLALRAKGRSARPQYPLARAYVTLTRVSPGPAPDFDNLAGSFKHTLDALCPPKGSKPGLSILLDDKPSVIGVPVVRWRRAERGEKSHIEITIKEVLEDADH